MSKVETNRGLRESGPDRDVSQIFDTPSSSGTYQQGTLNKV